jgi:phage-related protein
MERIIARKGALRTIAFARLRSDESPGAAFYDGLPMKDKVKLDHSFRLMADHGRIDNEEKFSRLEAGLFEFKEFQIRMPCAWDRHERGLLIITHGFIKKRNRAPREEIQRAWRIFEEDQEQAKLRLVRKKGP